MTLHGSDLAAITVLVVCGLTVCYALFLRKLRATLADRRMEIADQIGALDGAIRVLEARLAEHQLRTRSEPSPSVLNLDVRHEAEQSAVSEELAPEIHAAIAAATVATVGHNAVVQSVKPVTSPWTQQGRVLVQGGHNLRVRR